MQSRLNPFHDTFATETTSPSDFVRLFSPQPPNISTDTLSLFRTGNVVLTGVQGCGKSMLLALLTPEIRIAFQANDTSFPVPKEVGNFISAGINLTLSGASDFGQRSTAEDPQVDRLWPLYFGDFVNYWIVRDLFSNLARYCQPDARNIAKQIKLHLSCETLDVFAAELAKHDCWSGYLEGLTTFESLRRGVGQRLRLYRDYLNYNCDMPAAISGSKTTAGEPIAVTAELLRNCGVIAKGTQVYVRFDQYEELTHLEEWSRTKGIFFDYRAIIHKMLGRRDGRVHYRIGTRRYAWPESPKMYSTSAIAENLRNFTVIDLDELLRRKENTSWVFPGFAEDVFARRLSHAGFGHAEIKDMFGQSLSAKDKAARYVKNSPESTIDCEADWPAGCCNALIQIATTDPLSAKLGEAYLRQSLGENEIISANDLLRAGFKTAIR